MVIIGTVTALLSDNVELKANLWNTIMPIGIKYYSSSKHSTGIDRDAGADRVAVSHSSRYLFQQPIIMQPVFIRWTPDYYFNAPIFICRAQL
jgi:hypothetical protein